MSSAELPQELFSQGRDCWVQGKGLTGREWLAGLGYALPESRALHQQTVEPVAPLPQEGEAAGRRSLYLGIKARVAKLAFHCLGCGACGRGALGRTESGCVSLRNHSPGQSSQSPRGEGETSQLALWTPDGLFPLSSPRTEVSWWP